MTRLMRPALFLLLVLCAGTTVIAGDKAKDLYEKGADAQARQDYEKAYDFFKQAYDLKPKDLRYRTAYERNKFLAAAAHVHRGQLLRDDNKLEEARVEFEKALMIDASSFIAQQELKRTLQMIQEAQNPQPQASVGTGELRKFLSTARGPVDLAPISNAPITLKLTEKSNVIYETVGKLAGVNVLFDPDYTPRQVRIELNGVTLEEALSIISFETKTFWRPITPNTIFVAQDNPAKRKELEQNVLKTFYLSNLSQPTELQDVVNAMRTILEVSRIQQLPSQGAIVVRGTPDQVALAQKLVDDLDKAKPEVLIDVAVMEVSRDKMKNLGISPPTTMSVALQPNVNTSSTGSTGSTGGVPTSTNGQTTNGVTLNTLAYLNATDFQVTIPPASATALLSDSNSKIVQNPQVRALDGQKATLKIGERVPVATGSFQPGIGGVGINPLVNTQFQYIDVGVNIDITPRVHAGREISMKMTLDVSAVTSYVSIGGISQPVIGQRKIEHEIRLKDGEVNLLGGIMEDQQTRALTGIPGLAQIPILKWLFSQTNTEHQQDEIVFVLTPHIIRGIETPPGSRDLLDVGTANAIELRRTTMTTAPASQTPATQAPAAQPPATTVPPNPQGAGVGRPGFTPPNQVAMNPAIRAGAPGMPAPQAGSGATGSFIFDPPSMTQAKGSTFTVNVLLTGGENVYSVPVQLNYDPNQLQVINVSNGGFLSQDGQAVALVHRDDPSTGTLQVTATRPPGVGGVSGQGSVLTLTFMAKAPGQSALTITRGGARDPAMQPINMNGAQAAITIQ
ncbi:MAG TPA: cohesin domain-containing protein [Terriglobales bacterium]|nr:cohesin domain-containing protein [Terriglobales bacterium]